MVGGGERQAECSPCPLPASVLPAYPRPRAQNYDPWSAGRPRITVDFISDLDAEAEDRRMVENALAKLDEDKGAGGEVAAGAEAGGAVPADSAAVRAAAVFADHENLAKEDAKAATEAREAIQLRNIFSLSRHGKYREVEEMLNSPDWTLGVDAKDAQGNTLLMVAAQNNNKRIAKLALRRGAQINEQNVRRARACSPAPVPPLAASLLTPPPPRAHVDPARSWPAKRRCTTASHTASSSWATTSSPRARTTRCSMRRASRATRASPRRTCGRRVNAGLSGRRALRCTVSA